MKKYIVLNAHIHELLLNIFAVIIFVHSEEFIILTYYIDLIAQNYVYLVLLWHDFP